MFSILFSMAPKHKFVKFELCLDKNITFYTILFVHTLLFTVLVISAVHRSVYVSFPSSTLHSRNLFLVFPRSSERFCLPVTRWSIERRILQSSCSPRRLPQVLHLLGRSSQGVWLPNRHSIQDWRLWWNWQLRRPRRCSRMVSSYKV